MYAIQYYKVCNLISGDVGWMDDYRQAGRDLFACVLLTAYCTVPVARVNANLTLAVNLKNKLQAAICYLLGLFNIPPNYKSWGHNLNSASLNVISAKKVKKINAF